jgi:hypothetical protein
LRVGVALGGVDKAVGRLEWASRPENARVIMVRAQPP